MTLMFTLKTLKYGFVKYPDNLIKEKLKRPLDSLQVIRKNLQLLYTDEQII